MGCHIDDLLDDLISGLPTSPDELQRRWALARDAVLALSPELATCKPDEVRAEALRLIFASLELFLFASRYRTAFENNHRFDLVWRLVHEPDAPDCLLELDGDHALDSHKAHQFFVELVVSPVKALAGVRSAPANVPRPADDVDLLDALLHAMLRLMMQTAATAVCTTTDDVLMLTASLLERVDAAALGSAS